MLVTQKPILTALLGSGTVDEFLTQYWPRRPYVAHGSPARFPQSLRSAQLASVHALSQAYKGRVAFTHGRKTDKMVPSGGVAASVLFNMGLTVIFEDIGTSVPGAIDFLRGLERELGVNESCAVMSAFASPHTDGVACHYDAQDVISVQLAGTKRFHYAPVREIAN